MIKRLQNAEGEEVNSHEELRNGRDIFKAADVYMIEISARFPAAIQRVAEANIRPCRQPHQQQKQRPYDDGSQTPDMGTVREVADSRVYALHGRPASCAAHLLVARHVPLVGAARSTGARLVAAAQGSSIGGRSSQQQKQRVSPPVQTPRQCCLGGALSLRSARGGVVKQSWTTCEKRFVHHWSVWDANRIMDSHWIKIMSKMFK